MGPNNLVVRAYWFKETVVCVCDTEKKFPKITEHYHEFAGLQSAIRPTGCVLAKCGVSDIYE